MGGRHRGRRTRRKKKQQGQPQPTPPPAAPPREQATPTTKAEERTHADSSAGPEKAHAEDRPRLGDLWRSPPCQTVIEHRTKGLPYLAYAVLAWLPILWGVTELTELLNGPTEGSHSLAQICQEWRVPGPSDADPSITDLSDLRHCTKFNEYGLFCALRRCLPRDLGYGLLSLLVLLFLLIHAFRVFMGAYFVRNDTSWISARDRWYAELTPPQRSWRRAFETSLILGHIFALGALVFMIKHGSIYGAPIVVFVQGLFFLWSLWVFRRPLKLNEQKWESRSILIADLGTVAIAGLLLYTLNEPSRELPALAIVIGIGGVIALFVVEFLVTYWIHLVNAVNHFIFLLMALLGIRQLGETERSA